MWELPTSLVVVYVDGHVDSLTMHPVIGTAGCILKIELGNKLVGRPVIGKERKAKHRPLRDSGTL
jgi:hypothetical protein